MRAILHLPTVMAVVLAVPRFPTAVCGNANLVAIRIQWHRRRGDRRHRHVFAVFNHRYGGRLEVFVARDQALKVCRASNIALGACVEAHAVVHTATVERHDRRNGASASLGIADTVANDDRL